MVKVIFYQSQGTNTIISRVKSEISPIPRGVLCRKLNSLLKPRSVEGEKVLNQVTFIFSHLNCGFKLDLLSLKNDLRPRV